MKKVIIATAITALFSTMATANSGLADRINEARSYPNKAASTKGTQMHYMKNKQNNTDISEHQVIRGELRNANNEGNYLYDHCIDHTHS